MKFGKGNFAKSVQCANRKIGPLVKTIPAGMRFAHPTGKKTI